MGLEVGWGSWLRDFQALGDHTASVQEEDEDDRVELKS